MGDEHKRALLAVILSGFILFTWQYYFVAPVVPVTPSERIDQSDAQNSEKSVAIEKDSKAFEDATDKPIEPEKTTVNLSNNGFVVQVSTDLQVHWLENPTAAREFHSIVGHDEPLLIKIEGQSYYFEIVSQSENEVSLNHDQFQVIITLNTQGELLFNARGLTDKSLRFNFNSQEKTNDYYHTRQFVYYKNKLYSTAIDSDDLDDGKIRFLGIDYDYHLFALSFPKAVVAKLVIDQSQMNAQFVNISDELNFKLTFTKKEYDRLVSMGNQLHNAVDFGFFSILAVPILRLLQFFYNLIPNWGIAIILLTLVIRFITFPLQFKSLKSMNKMQKIQPDLAKIREKYKEDPQRLQKESMELFKRSGANPISGCLPLLLQMPIFFAFYQVLSHSVELVDAPFYFWIADLSTKDPYYVLPFLMAASMFVQQKITPSVSADPMQKKVLMFMPLIIGFIMKDLASGLNLYIFVSTLLGIIQQLLVFNKIK